MALLGVAGAAPAGATVIEHERFSETDSFTDTECGFTLQVQSTASGQTLLRVDNGGQAFLQHTNVRFRDVATNPETGRSFVIRGHVLYNDVKATQISDTVYEFVAVEAGQPFVIEDAAGQVIVRDRGVIRHTFLFDTLGDSQPGGVFLVETDTAVHGPHPGFSPDFPFCEIAAELTGA
ncbi:MAG TPA: hypothetical protein VNT03_19740 [Baekduia sp.]|nr:hypothetical protein [Baekduia sp.]